jgi:hypothetical protein
MKNSTLVYTLIALGFIIWLFFKIPGIMLIFLAIALGIYLVACLVDLSEEDEYYKMLGSKRNIFLIITKALDSLPPFIKKK